MTQEEAIKLLNIIKADDLASFCMLAKDRDISKLSFGRFPILSVCYLFGSKKILKKFEKQLCMIAEFECVYEPFVLYNDFKVKCGKTIRLYAAKNNFVMPIEMQAILHKDGFVKKHFKTFAKLESTSATLKKIYELYEQKFTESENKVKISAKKMSKTQKRVLIWANSVFWAVVLVTGSIFGICAATVGLGTSFSPKRITDSGSLAKLAASGNYAVLQNDIILENEVLLGDFSGTIDGNNKTITISYPYCKNLVNTLSGTIKNLNIEFDDLDFELTESLSLLAQTNNGTIENVNIKCKAKINCTILGTESYFSAFAITNNKYIHNCSATLDIDIISSSDSETCVAGIAGKNLGTISSSEITSGSKITAQNIDVAGIVAQNLADAEISTTKNYANLSQSTNLSTWSPNVAGIAMTNAGTISNCLNFGNISASNTAETSTNSAILVAGICSNNTATINHCKNECEITATSESAIIYAGGITAYTTSQTNTDNPTINFCGTKGNFNLTKNSNEVFLYCGGISGFMTGTITNCYSISTFSNAYNQETLNMTALMIGASYGQMYFGGSSVFLNIQDVYCLASEKTDKTLAIAYTNMGYTFIETLNADIEICATEEQIKESSIYWE